MHTSTKKHGIGRAVACGLLSALLVVGSVPAVVIADEVEATPETVIDETPAPAETPKPEEAPAAADQTASGESAQELVVVQDEPDDVATTSGTGDASDEVAVEPDEGTAPTASDAGAADATLSAQSDLTTAAEQAHVTYRTHVQKKGWQKWKTDGGMSGTSGKGLRLEGINIKLKGAPYAGGIQYRTHVQKVGWQGWRKDGKMSGTKGRGLRLEAIQIRLYGQMADHFDVYYRVHAQKAGWMGWASNGDSSGTQGFAYRLEGIQIVLVPKGDAAPADDLGGRARTTEAPFVVHTPRKYQSLRKLGINYDARVNKKVDATLERMTKFYAMHGIDYNALTSDYDKATGVLLFVGMNFGYGGGSYTAESMIDRGYGTCFAYSDLVLCMARKVGLRNSWLCVPGRPMAHGGMIYGSQHRTVVSQFDGQYWDLDGNLAALGEYYPQHISKSYAMYLLGKANTFTSFT